MRTPMIFCAGLAIALAGGCSGKFARDERRARRTIERAEASGTSDGALTLARDSLEMARDAERLALHDKDQATRDRNAASRRLAEKRGIADRFRGALVSTAGEIAAAEQAKLAAEVRAAGLRAKGLSPQEHAAAEGGQVTLAEQRIASLRTERATRERQLALAEAEAAEAELQHGAAASRIESAGRRLELARALYQQAQQQARQAELEDAARRRGELDARLRN